MRRLLLPLAALATLSSACGGPSGFGVASSNSASALPPRSNAVHKRQLPSELLFIPTETGAIDIYPLQRSKQGPVAQITGLTAIQQGMTVDANNDLFVVNTGGFGNDFYVSEYAPPYDGAPTILNTYWAKQVFDPIGIAVDKHGTVYVSSCGRHCLERPAIYVYPPGATSPSSRITSPHFNTLAGLALDVNDNLYAFNWNNKTYACDVFEIAAGSTRPKAMNLRGLSTGNGGNGLAFDAAGHLYVASSSFSSYVLEYKLPDRDAMRVRASVAFGDAPTMLDVGPDDNLYVPESCSFQPCVSVYAFKPGAKNPFEAIGRSDYPNYTLGATTAPNLLLEGSKR
jgi:hypothetical protein